ncbi:MAG TPA: VIT domain-containing protein [Kofleriaceae bacterium]|nr:VIT domain-containing protein [Kofleriaceae bacterium]
MVRPGVAIAVLLTLAAGLGRPGTAAAADLPRAIGMYPASGPALALVDSKVEVSVRGPIAEVLVTQRFQNRADQATEATYIFPLPADAAVTAMWIKTGGRTLRAAVERREDAQHRYEDAIRRGASAGLLDQERPDVFTQTVAAIPGKGTVEVTLRYDTVARYRGGTWELVLPMVVAPRYVPGAATARPTTGAGRSPDTDRAPDASRVTPPGGPGAGGPTDVVIRFVDKVVDPMSPTHELRASGGEATFTDPKTDHDAIVRWRAAVPSAGWVEQGPDGGYAAVVVEAPPAAPRKGAVRCTVVLDRSAASLGDADAVARPFVRALLGNLGGADRVAIAGSDAIAWTAPADAQRALDQAWQAPAGPFDLTRALGAVRPEGGVVVLVTSGLVADDAAAVAAARKLGVPIHVVGVGAAPARGLLGQIAAASGGTARYLGAGDDAGALAKATLADAASPPAPLTVNWGALAASDVVPGVLPRLGAGQAVLVLARVRQAQAANARARGDVFAIEALPAPRAAPGATSAMGPLARRWARERLEELIGSRAAPAAIAAHALRYGLVSPHTSLVAIGEDVVVAGGVRRSVSVPVSVPAGMRWQAVKKQTTVETGAKDATVSQVDARGTPKPANTLDRGGGARGGEAGGKRDPDTVAVGGTGTAVGAGAGKTAKPTDVAVKEDTNKAAEKPARDRAKDGDKSHAKNDQKTDAKPEGKKKTATAKTDPTAPRTPTRTAAPPPPPAAAPAPEPAPPAEQQPGRSRRNADADEEDDLAGADAAPRKATAYGADDAESEGGAELLSISSGGEGRRLRISAGLGAGLAVAADQSAPLFALSARVELGRRTLLGVGASLWLSPTDGGTDVQGQVLATFARRGLLGRGLGRRLELGGGLGLQLGAGTGPAASASLRFHLPPAPRAATFLRYDGALLFEAGERTGQHAMTLGLEYGF